MGRAKLNVVKPGDTVRLGCFSVEFIHVNHSIPDAMAVAITTPVGVIIQTGDFKVDYTPIDDTPIDIARFAEYGKQGVLCLLSDSTNAERPGFSESEQKVGQPLRISFRRPETAELLSQPFLPTSTGSSRSSIWRSALDGKWLFPEEVWSMWWQRPSNWDI